MTDPLVLHGLGTAVPTPLLTQPEALHVARRCVHSADGETNHAVDRFFGSSSIRTRHVTIGYGRLTETTRFTDHAATFYPPADTPESAGPSTAKRMEAYERWAPELAIQASRDALAASGIGLSEIKHVVTVSCTGFSAPGIDVRLIKTLGLGSDVTRTHVGFMGCHGLMNALRVARALANCEPRGAVLVCAVELCSLHFQYGRKVDHIVANSLFADGAAALVASTTKREADIATLVDQRSIILPDTEDLMQWRVRDHGFEMRLSPAVPGVIEAQLRPWLERWLADHSLRVHDIDGWIVHPGGRRVLDAVRDVMDLADEALASSTSILADYGNMSSATVLFVLDHLLKTRPTRQGLMMMLAFGPGLAIEGTLLEAASTAPRV